MAKKSIAMVLNEMQTRPIIDCLEESGLSEEEKGMLVMSIMEIAKKSIKVDVRAETNDEWATRIGGSIDRLTGVIEEQTTQFTRMAEALEQFIDLTHPGRFAEGLKLVVTGKEESEESSWASVNRILAKQRDRFLPRVEMTCQRDGHTTGSEETR